MARNIVHSGGDDDVLPFQNGNVADISAGQVVVMMHTIGIALVDIPKNATGNVAVGGVVRGVPKVSGAVFVQGEKLIWDTSAGAFDDSAAAPAAGDITGAVFAWLPGASGETTCTVKLTPGNTDIGS